MINGFLPIDYVKSHHPIWYEKLTGKSAEQTSAEKVGLSLFVAHEIYNIPQTNK
jgi:hypothetical protein